MSSQQFRMPKRMLPASLLAGRVEVTRAPALRLEGEGTSATPKTNDSFPGRQAYSMAVEIITGQRKKKLPDGQEITIVDTREQPVTVWADRQPEASVGQYVLLENLMIGSVDRSFYAWATGVRVAPMANQEEEK